MPKQMWIKDASGWQACTNVWVKDASGWHDNVIPYRLFDLPIIGKIWVECMSYGYDVDINFENSTHNITWTSSTWDAYREVEIAGMKSGDILRLDFDYTYTISSGSCTAVIYTRINGGSWVRKTNYMTSSDSGSITLTGIDDNDTVDTRLYLYNNVGSNANLSIELDDDGSYLTTGDGTVVVGTPSTWSIGFLPLP